MPICSSGIQRPLFSAASLEKDVIGQNATPPSHIVLLPGQPCSYYIESQTFLCYNAKELRFQSQLTLGWSKNCIIINNDGTETQEGGCDALRWAELMSNDLCNTIQHVT